MKYSQLAIPALLTLAVLPAKNGLAAPHATEVGHVRMAFEPNRGQAEPGVRYLSRGLGYTLLLRDREAVLALSQGQGNIQTVGFQWLNSKKPLIRAEDATGGVSNYLTSAVHRTGIAH